MRYLCVDLGDKRTGLAIGDEITLLAMPVGVLEVSIKAREGEALLEALTRAVREHGPTALVMGLALNMDGSEGPRAKLARGFGERLARATGLTVHYQDERLTSAEADWTMARSGLTRDQKKARRDALAACAVLRDFLLQRARAQRGADPAGDPETAP